MDKPELRVSERFIPVDTGNTIKINTIGPRTTVHPCGYREHEGDTTISAANAGSSLWIQGTPDF